MLALAGGTIYTEPFAEPIAGGTVLVDHERICAAGTREEVEIPNEARTIDCTGLRVTAGFWNCHVHFFERKWADAASIPAGELAEQLRDFTRFGFTSVFDLGSASENTRVIRDRIASGEVDGPAIYSTGQIIIPPGAMPPENVLRVLGTVIAAPHEAANARDAADAADALLSEGSDAVKIFMSGNAPGQRLTQEAVHAAVQRAHLSQKLVFAHTNDGEDVLAALAAGVDVIAHTTPRSGPWSAEILESAKRSGAALTPTLALWPHLLRHDRLSLARSLEEAAIQQVRAWTEAAATVLFGTDYGAVPADPAPEFALMRSAGMSFPQILASLTTEPAKRFGKSDSGRIATGLAADLAVFETPFQVRYTIRRGCVVHG